MILSWVQIISSALLVVLILVQQRGTGLSGTFGGSEAAAYSTRRGVEKHIYRATVVMAVVFIAASAAQLVL